MGQPALWRLFASRVPGAAVVLRQVQPALCDDRFPGEGGPGREIVTRKPQRESIMRGVLRSLTLGSRLEVYFPAARCLSSALRDCWHLWESCRGDRGHAHHLQSLAYWVGADALGELYRLPDELPDTLHSGARLRMCTVHDGEPELARLPRLWKSQIKGLLGPGSLWPEQPENSLLRETLRRSSTSRHCAMPPDATAGRSDGARFARVARVLLAEGNHGDCTGLFPQRREP
jgi:hypothetical protein